MGALSEGFATGQAAGGRFSGAAQGLQQLLGMLFQQKALARQQAIQESQFGRTMAATLYGTQAQQGLIPDPSLAEKAYPGYTAPTAGAGTSQFSLPKQLEMAKTAGAIQKTKYGAATDIAKLYPWYNPWTWSAREKAMKEVGIGAPTQMPTTQTTGVTTPPVGATHYSPSTGKYYDAQGNEVK